MIPQSRKKLLFLAFHAFLNFNFFSSCCCASWRRVQWRRGWRVGDLSVSCSCLAKSSLCIFVWGFLLEMGSTTFSFLNGISKCLGSRNQKCYIGSAAIAHLLKLQIQMKWCFRMNALWLEGIVTCPWKSSLGCQTLGLQSWGTLGCLQRGQRVPSGPVARGVERFLTEQSKPATPGSEH